MRKYNFQLPDSRFLSVSVFGEPKEKVILFFHGSLSSKSCIYPYLTNKLPEDVCLIAFNRAGIGKSSVKKDYTPTEIAEDIDCFLEDQKIKKVSLFSCSNGGVYAMAYSLRYAEKVDKIALVNSAVPFVPLAKKAVPNRWKRRAFLNRYFPVLEQYYFTSKSKRIINDTENEFERHIKKMISADREVLKNPIIKEMSKHTFYEAYMNEGKGIIDDIKAITMPSDLDLKQISKKTYIWHGVEDQNWTVHTAKYLNKHIPNSELILKENQGHLLYINCWNEIIEKLI